jgi:membrane protein
VKRLFQWSKKVILPGFHGIGIYYIIRFILEEIEEDNLTTRANAMAFSFFLSLFPATIFLFTLVPYFGLTNEIQTNISETIYKLMPANASSYLLGIIHDITNIRREGLLSFGFLFAIYFSASGMITMMIGFDKSHMEGYRKRSFIEMIGIALTLTFILLLLIVGSSILIILGDVIAHKADDLFNTSFFTSWFLSAFRWVFALSLVYLAITIIYRYGPAQSKRASFFNAGSIVATILSLLTSVLFSFFVNNFGRYNQLYGSIGALIIVLLWLKFNSLVILVGYELNTSIHGNIDRIKKKKQMV